MFNSIINGSKKSKSSKKNKNKGAEGELSAPPQIQAPGTYVREAGILFLTEKFDQEKIMPLVAQIYEYNIMPEELRPENITLVINSPGGSVHSAFHLIDAMMMSEQYSWGSQGKEHELHAKFKEFDMAGIRMENHYRKFTKKSVKYIRKHLLHATDEWLTPDECLKHGLVDEVINTYA